MSAGAAGGGGVWLSSRAPPTCPDKPYSAWALPTCLLAPDIYNPLHPGFACTVACFQWFVVRETFAYPWLNLFQIRYKFGLRTPGDLLHLINASEKKQEVDYFCLLPQYVMEAGLVSSAERKRDQKREENC